MIKIMSLFDGMSCAQQAINRLGVKEYIYYASEIDKYSIAVTQYNYPNTIQLGDITKINGTDYKDIDLLIGGSPCQGFSFAGKQLNFEDIRSKLFFEYIRLVKEINPKYFILENVRMKKEYKDRISELMGVQPIQINSALVSAQNRERLYWTNILNITQPEDKYIYLKDILEAPSVVGRMVGRRLKDGKRADYDYTIKPEQQIELRFDNKSGTLTTVEKDNLVITNVVNRDKSYTIDANYYKGGNLEQYFNHSRRQLVFIKDNLCFSNAPYGEKYKSCIPVNIKESKFRTLRTSAGGRTRGVGICNDDAHWRKLTPLECERLQTVNDNYTKFGNFNGVVKQVSDSQRYKMLGNGFTVDVIKHILTNIFKND